MPPISAATALAFASLMSSTATLAPALRQGPRRGRAQTRAAAGDQRRLTLDLHALLSCGRAQRCGAL